MQPLHAKAASDIQGQNQQGWNQQGWNQQGWNPIDELFVPIDDLFFFTFQFIEFIPQELATLIALLFLF
jgi:hypothetical protein